MKIDIIPATLADYPCIQNMARFYVYDLSRECGSISADWAMPQDGLYESFDFKKYFDEPTRKAFLVKIDDEIAGFVLLNQATENPKNIWNIGEFFIIAKFQDKGIGSRVAEEIWKMNPGKWEVSVIPNNKKALNFWEKTIGKFTGGAFNRQILKVTYDEHCPRRVVFEFDTQSHTCKNTVPEFNIRASKLSDIRAMVALSKIKRLSYEQAQPQFWKYAVGVEQVQAKWFEELLDDAQYIMLVEENLKGFIIGRLIKAPEVYNPGGLTLMIDDFCVVLPELWQTVGLALVSKIKEIAKEKGAAQILVVSGDHDVAKNQFLEQAGLTVASRWYVRGIK